MKMIMLSCNTGEGHNSTAKAIQNVLTARGVECEIMDVLACLSPSFSKFVCNWHARLYKYAPKLWDVSYRAFEKKHMRSDERAMLYELLRLGTKELRVILEKGCYDAILCTHVFSGMMMTELRKSRGVNIPCYFISTDYTCHPYTDQCEMDGYFIPAPELAEEFAAAGIPRDKLIATGIPVRQEFYRKGDKQKAKAELGIESYDLVTILMCGSMGCGPMKKLAQQLPSALPGNSLVVCMCGKNEKLYETMRTIGDPGLRVLGYCDRVSDYMDAADLIITKPGGLSSTEAGNKGLPMVFINAVGGCESRNFDFFLKYGYAVGDDRPEAVLRLAGRLASSTEERQAMAEALKKGFRNNSAEDIGDVLTAAAREYRKNAETAAKPRTFQNLIACIWAESQTTARYRIYADVARREDQERAARAFEEVSRNQAAHASRLAAVLKELGATKELDAIAPDLTGRMGSTLQNLAVAEAEAVELGQKILPDYAETAGAEGLGHIGELLLEIGSIADVHASLFAQVRRQLNREPESQKAVWHCLNCGHTYEDTLGCDPCPVCRKSLRWQSCERSGKYLPHRK